MQQKMQNIRGLDNNCPSSPRTTPASGNSQVEYGNLLSCRWTAASLYVEPIYLKSTAANSYPLMKKVLLSYGTSLLRQRRRHGHR